MTTEPEQDRRPWTEDVATTTQHGCFHMFGHACFRELGHPGRCDDRCDVDPDPCMTAQRPKDWDTKGRAEANR